MLNSNYLWQFSFEWYHIPIWLSDFIPSIMSVQTTDFFLVYTRSEFIPCGLKKLTNVPDINCICPFILFFHPLINWLKVCEHDFLMMMPWKTLSILLYFGGSNPLVTSGFHWQQAFSCWPQQHKQSSCQWLQAPWHLRDVPVMSLLGCLWSHRNPVSQHVFMHCGPVRNFSFEYSQ